MAILAEGKFGVITSKTAACLIRYQPERVACVIDSTKSGSTAGEVLGFGGGIPVVGSVSDAMDFRPDSMLVGIAPKGGLLPEAWRCAVAEALASGLNVLSGLHTMLGDDPELSGLARTHGVAIWDIRRPVLPDGVSTGRLSSRVGRVVLTVGSDCSTGKMTVSYELAAALKGRGLRAEFVPTGQTGVVLAGWGQAVDRVPGDFMARVVEDLTLEALSRSDIAVVEGQGSLVHPAYSGVTLAILHGAWPDAMVLCHQPTRTRIEEFDMDIPPLAELIDLYERLCLPLFRCRVVAVALNTYDMDATSARAAIAGAQRDTGLPATDAVRFGAETLCDSLRGIL
jgi:uncharacterized NAD-dependent epimerase/dehydratase family protein